MAQDRKAAARKSLEDYRARLGGQGVPMTSDLEDLVFHMLELFDPIVADATLSNIVDRRAAAGRPTPYTRPEQES
jgi:hypothetical protein